MFLPIIPWKIEILNTALNGKIQPVFLGKQVNTIVII